jgi:hypothetical protein
MIIIRACVYIERCLSVGLDCLSLPSKNYYSEDGMLYLPNSWGVAWCIITSFEKLYEEASGPLGGRAPTIGVFNHYFSLVASNYYYTIRKKSGVIKVFDFKNTNI